MSGKRHHPRRIWLVSIGDEGNGYHWTDSKPDIDAEEYVMVGRDRPTDENDTIYLQPWCQGCEGRGRQVYTSLDSGVKMMSGGTANTTITARQGRLNICTRDCVQVQGKQQQGYSTFKDWTFTHE